MMGGSRNRRGEDWGEDRLENLRRWSQEGLVTVRFGEEKGRV